MPKPVFLYVVDFDRLQHYKNRNPPWIKLYSDLWDNPDFEELPDASKAHFVGICVLASKHNNRMPLNIEWIEKHISAVTPLDLKVLYASGLLAHSGKVLAERLQDASAEERERQRRVETERETDCPVAEKRTGKPDEAAEFFKASYLEHIGNPYGWQAGDFPQLAKLRKRLELATDATPPDWENALLNYFASPFSEFTLKHFASKFDTFKNSSLDRYRTPVNHKGNGNGRETRAEEIVRKNAEAAKEVCAAIDRATGDGERIADPGREVGAVRSLLE